MTTKSTIIIAIALIISSIFISIGFAVGGQGIYSFSRTKGYVFKYNNFTGSMYMCRNGRECIEIGVEPTTPELTEFEKGLTEVSE